MDVPGRWEWRMFAREITGVFGLPRFDAETIPTLSEVYVLSIASVNNVKIRDNCLDIKTLQRVDQMGLQQWRPTLKATFPIDQAALESAWAAWGLPHPIVEETHCSLQNFLSIAAAEKCLRAVNVEKRRFPLLIQGCPGERVELKVGGQRWEGLSFEHADPYRVWRAVRSLGFENAENTSYPQALKKIVDFLPVEAKEKMEAV